MLIDPIRDIISNYRFFVIDYKHIYCLQIKKSNVSVNFKNIGRKRKVLVHRVMIKSINLVMFIRSLKELHFLLHFFNKL